MADNYNSQWTGAQIDEAISDVRKNKTAWDGKLDKTGGTMTGALVLAGAPTGDLDAATKKFVEDKIAAIPTPDVSGQIATHNTSAEAHSDIRQAVSNAASAAGTAQSAASAAQTAANSKAPATHASQHAAGGSDPITPESIGAAEAFTVYCEVPYDGWTDGSSLGYYVDITDGNVDYGDGNPSYSSLSGVILVTDVPIVDVDLVTTYTDNEAYLTAWACVQRIEALDGCIRVYVGDAVPEVAFNIIVKVVR